MDIGLIPPQPGALFTTGDIITTQKYAVEIQNKTPPQFHGRKDKNYPYGRFPHQFINNPSPPSMEFPAYCDDEANRKEYPMVNPAQESPYKGSINNNVNWGKHRLLYIHKIGDTHSIFCGLMTHEDQPRGTFDYCTPRR